MKPHSGTTRSRGFTLIELMITVVILAILVGIAMPSYTAYIRQGNRSDAIKSLLLDAQTLQRCYSQNFSYSAAGCPVVSGTTTSSNGYYSIVVAITSATAYTLTANPIKSPQTGDTQCTQFQLLSTGAQLATPTANAQLCWGSQ